MKINYQNKSDYEVNIGDVLLTKNEHQEENFYLVVESEIFETGQPIILVNLKTHVVADYLQDLASFYIGACILYGTEEIQRVIRSENVELLIPK